MVGMEKCRGVGCPERGKCHRHTAPNSVPYQSWMAEISWDGKTGTCGQFIPNGYCEAADAERIRAKVILVGA